MVWINAILLFCACTAAAAWMRSNTRRQNGLELRLYVSIVWRKIGELPRYTLMNTIVIAIFRDKQKLLIDINELAIWINNVCWLHAAIASTKLVEKWRNSSILFSTGEQIHIGHVEPWVKQQIFHLMKL